MSISLFYFFNEIENWLIDKYKMGQNVKKKKWL